MDDGDDNLEALERAIDAFEARIAAALDHARAAQRTVTDRIDACTSMYLNDLGPMGEAFRNFAQQLLEAEGDLSRTVGELDAHPDPGL